MKRYVNPFDYAGQILTATKGGALLTTKADGICNTMTIGWGTIGVEWSKNIFVAFVRGSRYTKSLLDKNPEFTVNLPVGSIDKNILKVCGTVSGRDTDKIAQLGLTLEDPDKISVPGIRQLPLTLECRVVSRLPQEARNLAQPHFGNHYPDPIDPHIAYYGEITAAYILE
jgi:flavin reductase (DIM6/NTAB) family NADH-FMN oxidoreductase RutF